MRKIILALVVAAVAVATGAWSTSPSSSGPVSGTEHIHGTITGAAADSNNPTVHLSFTGPVSTSGSTSLGGNTPAHGQTHSFSTRAGKLTIVVTNHPNPNPAPKVDQATCAFTVPTVVNYKIDAAGSTGTWAKATGTGTVTVTFGGTLPKLSSGKCNMSNNATPSNVHASFVGVGPVKVSG